MKAIIRWRGHDAGEEHTICIWYDKEAEAAAQFYAATFPDSKVTAVHKAPSDYPSGKKGDELTVEFTVLGNSLPRPEPRRAHGQAQRGIFISGGHGLAGRRPDKYWNAIVGNGGKESACGWCKDKWGISWQITPRVLMQALSAGGDEAKRAFGAMMTMKKIDVAAIEKARKG